MRIAHYYWRDDAGNVIQITRRRRGDASTYVMLVRTTSGFELESDVSPAAAAEALRRMQGRHKKSVFHLP